MGNNISKKGPLHLLIKPGILVFIIGILASFYVGKQVPPTWSLETSSLDVKIHATKGHYYTYKKKPVFITPVSIDQATLTTDSVRAHNAAKTSPKLKEEIIVKTEDGQPSYYKHRAVRHWRVWSLLPALVAITMCFVIREPLTALGSGIIAGAFLVGEYDLTKVLTDSLATQNAAGIIVLYLLLLGGLLGIWAKNGAAKAFAELMTKHLVRGPRTAKLVVWILGVIFHQGGTMSTVLVGTTVKPITDQEKVSHEELSYIVDSTASPIAAILPFNAWPAYVQALIYVPGVAWLATESDRISFFMKSIPLSFYSIFAVLMTLAISLEIFPQRLINKQLREATERARTTGKLDADGAETLSEDEFTRSHDIPEGYETSVWEFFIPIGLIIGISMYTFFVQGSPKVSWGFGIALLVALLMSLYRGMKLRTIIEGIDDGLKGVVYGSVILLFAITIGSISKSAGGGTYLVELLGTSIPFWILPVLLQLLTMIISFSTGTSWGTYAVTFPLAMPLAYAVAIATGLSNPELYMLICFATVLNGSVFGDQCSPISDTTVLSAMVSGCDLMDHVKTQFYQAILAAGAAAILWTALTFLAA